MERMERRHFLRLTGGVAATAFYAGGASAAESSGVTTVDRRIASFDGTEIASTVFLPPGDGQHPVVLSTHGWGGDRSSVAGYGRLLAQHGYVALTWDQRGFGESDGEVGLSGPKEVNDTSTLIDFLAGEHPQSDPEITARVATPGGDPRVGMIGASYGGGIQLNTAAVDHRIEALIPIVPWHDLTYSLAPNGVPKRGWVSLLYGSGVAAARGLQSGDGQPDQGDLQRGVSPRLHEIYAKTMAENELPPEGRSFLKVRSPAVKLDRIDAPSMVVQGWPDTLFVPNEGQRIVDGLRANGTEAKLVLFNGGHTVTETAEPADQVAYLEEKAIEWFDEHLRGEGESSIAPVTYYDVQLADALKAGGYSGYELAEQAFQSASSFPPEDTTERTFDLSADATSAPATTGGTTTLANSVAPTSASQISPQNGDFASGATSADFEFTFDEPTELIGTPELTLTAEPLGTRGFVFAKAYHVTDAGATLVNNQAIPIAVESTPGSPTTQTVEMVSFQRRFAAGDSLRITLATTDVGFNGARRSTGVRVHHDGTEVTMDGRSLPETPTRSVTVTGSRTDDGRVFTGGQTNQVDLDVQTSAADRPAPKVLLRDRVPEAWTLVGGEGRRDGEHVVFRGAKNSHERTYFVEAPGAASETNAYTFGPVEYSVDGGNTWSAVGGTTEDNYVLGTETPE